MGAIWKAIKKNKKDFLHLIGVLIKKNTESFHKSLTKIPTEQKAKIKPSVKIRIFCLLLYLFILFKLFLLNTLFLGYKSTSSIKMLAITSHLVYPKALTTPLKIYIRTKRMSLVNTSSSMTGMRKVLTFLVLVVLFLLI
ncbi:hypothetical protein PanWU01x14_106720 [Parasponia andersonii]|uniref:Transmembrane protein n=1 Tax=Parasponia andersonii TaxID=3476 RepID=A0A2P5D0Q9_PARAD|nr:hypothetical protein PanWU01x14_106720 [Parasponia andersonii]